MRSFSPEFRVRLARTSRREVLPRLWGIDVIENGGVIRESFAESRIFSRAAGDCTPRMCTRSNGRKCSMIIISGEDRQVKMRVGRQAIRSATARFLVRAKIMYATVVSLHSAPSNALAGQNFLIETYVPRLSLDCLNLPLPKTMILQPRSVTPPFPPSLLPPQSSFHFVAAT